MNIRPDIHGAPPPTDGPCRRLWTAIDLRLMEEAGLLRPDERVELIAGEIFRMSPKGNKHEVLRNELVLFWARRLPLTVKFAEEPPLRLDEHTEPEPDIILSPASQRVAEVTGESVLLVVEVADSSLAWDLQTKSRIYAAFGVREYWVIDATTLITTVHREPSADGYRQVSEHATDQVVTPMLAPTLAVRMAELPL